MKEHPDIVKFCHFSAYVRTRSAGILRGLTPWHTDFGTKSSVLHLVRGVQAPGTHVRSDYSQTRHIGGRPSSHKANLIPQSKRQDTTIIVIPCLCSFTVPSSPSAEPPINKKRTRTLFRKESGSSTNCMVDGTGLEPVTSCTSSRCSTSWANRPYSVFCRNQLVYVITPFEKKQAFFAKNIKLFWNYGLKKAFSARERRFRRKGSAAFCCSHCFVVI